MCTCIKDIEAKILADQPVRNRKIVRVSVSRMLYKMPHGKVDLRLSVKFNCRMEGYKAARLFDVPALFCPFCGEKLGD